MGTMRSIFLLCIVPAALCAAPIDYKVHFLGVDDPDVLKTVRSASFLSTLKQKKPESINILRSRAESDIPDILKALHSHGYYDATAQVQIVEENGDVDVFVMIQTGPVYTIESFEVACPHHFTPEELGVKMGSPMLTLKVLNAVQKVLELLSECGFPGSKIIDQQFIADYKTKKIAIHLKVDSGPEANFGSTTVTGAPHIKKELFENKIAWEEGTTYDTRLVDQTQKKLLDTGLFSSVIITHEQEKDGRVPMKIESLETKHKNINIGASYQTFFGPGLTFGWENRNVSGRGRTLSLKGDVTAKNHTGTALFFVPDCGRVDQDFAAQAQVMQEAIVTYHEHSYSITSRIERRIDTRYRFAVGLKVERLLVSNSVSDGTFTLTETPLYFRYSSANNLLDPTRGATLEVVATPSMNFSHFDKFYLSTSVAYAFYKQANFFVFANMVTLHSIWSRNLDSVPVPKRVLGGTDELLRGYKFKTVSPLHHHHKPIGGRFGLFYTLEGRFRLSQTIGVVPFFDIGIVELTPFPKWDEKWYKSVGIGFRYFTFMGPIRFDVAFPLDRRKHIDSWYRLLVSIGQTF